MYHTIESHLTLDKPVDTTALEALAEHVIAALEIAETLPDPTIREALRVSLFGIGRLIATTVADD